MAAVFDQEPTSVVDTKSLKIDEYFGRVASGDDVVSACVATVTGPCAEAWQTPAFDEYVIVLEGEVCIEREGEETVRVAANRGIFLPKGTRVRWTWEGPCKYVPICIPAFSVDNCGREPEAGAAKDEAAMLALRQLHAAKKHKWLYHVAQKSLWDACKASGETYYPPTYAQDKFTHATADATKLIDVLNHFYTDIEGEWVCLKTTQEALLRHGVPTVFEATAPVGDIPAIDMGDQLFPHLLGGIPSAEGAVLEELRVKRNPDGTFVEILGLDEEKKRIRAVVKKHMAFAGAAGFVLGAALAAGAAVLLARR